MSDETSDHRCVASCEVVPSVLKRCILPTDHDGEHLWVEALNRSDGRPMLARWSGSQKRPSVVAEIHLI